MMDPAGDMRDLIARYDAGFRKLRRLMASHRRSLDLVDPGEEMQGQLGSLNGVVMQIQDQLRRSTDTDQQIALCERLRQVYSEMASLKKRFGDEDGRRERTEYLSELRREHRQRLKLLRRMQNILQRLPHPQEEKETAHAEIGLPGSIASTGLLDCKRRPCHTRHPDTGAYAWSYGFAKRGDVKAPDREFPVLWFSAVNFPAKAQYSWLLARHLRRFRLEETSRTYWDAVRDFVHERNKNGCCDLTTDLDC
ncbi:hypothetical protein E4U43_003610, partial [Claviceps pusilla]